MTASKRNFKITRIIMSFALSATMLCGVCPVIQAAEASQVKNVIYMIPDGGGMEPFYLSDALKQSGGWDSEIYPNATKTAAEEMYAKQYLVGAITTYCANADITDSAAAGTAMSTGYKTNKSHIGVNTDKVPMANILEAAQYVGKNAGIVSTYEWTNATPAAFSAHDNDRGNYAPMSEQIVNQGIDVVLGSGFGAAKWGDIGEAQMRGYDIINTREDLQNVKPGDKIWGNLVSGGFPYDIEYDESIPNIAEMTKAAITALDDNNENGFFLMVEGSKVDGGGHSNYAQGMIGEFLAFDEACKVALQYAEGRDDTLVVIAPDHDTGGMNLPENLANAVKDLKKGTEPAEITWDSTDHTARNGGLFMYVPEGVEYPEGISGENIGEHKAYEENIIDNTQIAHYLAELMGTGMDDISAALFVDVTEMGTYDKNIELFRFNDYPVTIKRNASYAYLEDAVADLDGQVAVYINKKFYVPQLLLDIAQGTKEYEEYTTASLVDSALELYMPDTTDISKWNGKIEITNLQPKKPVSGKIKFTAPEAFAALDEFEVTSVEGTEPAVIEFECPQFDMSENGLTFKYEFITEDGTYKFSSAFEGRAYAGYANEPVTIDGKIDEEAWNDAIVMTCDDASRIVNIEDWKGDRDLSADFAMLWDSEYLYFHAVVTDEIFYQPAAESSKLWEGDSIQFGIHRDTEDATLHKKSNFEEVGFALINGEPIAHRFRKQTDATTTGPIESGEGFEMASVREGDDQIYELKIKWTTLFGVEFNPQIGDVLKFSVLFNDNDGGGRRGWMEYGSGIGSSKDYTQFVKMPLLDFSKDSSDAIKIMYNGTELVSDVAPFIANDRVLVPVRVIFEALGAEVNWDGATQTVVSNLGEDTVALQIGASEIIVNGEAKAIDSPAQLTNDRTMVPIKAIMEAYNCDVQWDDATRTVTVIK